MAPSTAYRRYTVLVVVGAAVAIILTALLANAPRPPLVEAVSGPPVHVPIDQIEVEESPEPEELAESPMPEPEFAPLDLPAWLPDLLIMLGVAILLGIVVALIRKVWEARIKANRTTAGEASGEGVEVVDIDEEEFVETVEETVRSLRQGIAVEGAVVECWRRLEHLAGESGITRHRAQTSSEFTVEVLGRTKVDESSIKELAELYRQAMFSTHTLTDADRERAIACLESLSSQLRMTP